MAQRVGGIVAGLFYAAAAAVVLQLLLLGWVLTRSPVTSIVWSEVLAGPVYVMFAGALAAALTRWMPHPATPLFGVLILAGLMIAFPYRQEDWGLNIGFEWLSPLAWPQDIIPYEVAFRPAGSHLGYLTGLTLLLAGIAMLGRWPVAWAVLGAGLALAAAMGQAQLGPIEDSQRAEAMSHLIGDQANFTCETHQRIEYCAMPGYEAWIDFWVQATQPVADSVPSEALESLDVRQYPVHVTFILDGQDYNNWWWVQPAYDDLVQRPNVMPVGSMWADYMNISVAGGLARAAMGCLVFCEGESQLVVDLWMSSHNPEIRSNIEESMSGRSDGASVVECMVAELWSKPEARRLIHSNWDALTSSSATYEDAGAILGVTVPTGEDEYGYLGHGCP
ncbi:hypothetical protein BH23ACT5_BH23ACT5_11110 [soil metagenome]